MVSKYCLIEAIFSFVDYIRPLFHRKTEAGKMRQNGEWKKIKLEEVLSNPAFLGKTARLGNDTFELKCVMCRNLRSNRKVESSTSDDKLFAFALCT
jgi:hypothetical protein